MRSRRPSGSSRSGYALLNEQMLEYDGIQGMRSVCHLFVYASSAGPLVCIVGNFDGGLGTPTTEAIETVATAIAARISRDAFRLLEWYPHDGERRFSEVTLTPVAPERLPRGQVIITSGTDAHAVRRDTAAVCFVDPRWRRRSEDEVAELLGEGSVRELRSFAGLPGDYIPERLFGAAGKELAGPQSQGQGPARGADPGVDRPVMGPEVAEACSRHNAWGGLPPCGARCAASELDA